MLMVVNNYVLFSTMNLQTEHYKSPPKSPHQIRRVPAVSSMQTILLILSLSLGVLSHPGRQKRQEGELGLAKEGFPASKEVAPGVYSFSNDGFYMSMFVVTSEGVMAVDPMNNNQAKVETGESSHFNLSVCL